MERQGYTGEAGEQRVGSGEHYHSISGRNFAGTEGFMRNEENRRHPESKFCHWLQLQELVKLKSQSIIMAAQMNSPRLRATDLDV